MAEITKITDFDAIEKAIVDGNSDGYERGMHKDEKGTVHQWNIGSGSNENDDGSVTNSITPFKTKKSHQADVNAYWYMHIHPTVKGYSKSGLSIPSGQDKYFDEVMRKYHYHGTTFVIGGRDLKITFYYERNTIISVPYIQLKKIITR